MFTATAGTVLCLIFFYLKDAICRFECLPHQSFYIGLFVVIHVIISIIIVVALLLWVWLSMRPLVHMCTQRCVCEYICVYKAKSAHCLVAQKEANSCVHTIVHTCNSHTPTVGSGDNSSG